jgi:hypothetical protein
MFSKVHLFYVRERVEKKEREREFEYTCVFVSLYKKIMVIYVDNLVHN